MSTTAAVSIDRASLSLSALDIGDSPGDTYCLTPEGLGEPEMTWRLGAMPDSASIHGREYISAALDESSLPLEIVVSGTSAANLATNKAALTTALSQFSYSVTVTVDSLAKVWLCGPANWSIGAVQHSHQVELVQVVRFTIPVYPVAS